MKDWPTDLVEQIDALLHLNKNGCLTQPIPALATELLEKCRARLTGAEVSGEIRHALIDLVAAVGNMRVPQNAAEAALQVTVTVGQALERARNALAGKPALPLQIAPEIVADLDMEVFELRQEVLRLHAHLDKIACHHVTESPLWWQLEARTALAPSSVSHPTPEPQTSAATDDLIERLRNPMWAHGNIPFESPQLEQEENIAAMNEAAAEIERLRALPQEAWKPGEREAVARALFGDGWECCAELGPYVQGVANELNEARALNAYFEGLHPDVVAKWRDFREDNGITSTLPRPAPEPQTLIVCKYCARRVFEPCQSMEQARNACTLSRPHGGAR